MRILQVPHLLLSVVVGFFGCTVKEAIETLRPTSFIEHEQLAPSKVTPFDLVWVSPNIAASLYDSLVVEAVRTDFVNPDNWIYSAGPFMRSRDAYIDEVNDLAEYMQRTVIRRFRKYPERDPDVLVEQCAPMETFESELEKLVLPKAVPSDRIEPVEPEGRALSVQISIAEANFGDPLLYAGLLAVPLPGVANMSTALKAPSLTLEARLVDRDTGELKMVLIDRRFPQVKIVDVNRLTISSALHELADSFAADLVRSFYRKPGHVVGRRWPFSLVPW